MGAAAFVAIVIRKEKEVVAEFRARGATSPERSVALSELNVHEGVGWRKLIQHAAVRQTADGRYYLDEPSWEATRSLRRRLSIILLTIVLVVALISALTTAGIVGVTHGKP